MKTALVLSGGGSKGAYEIGVCKALKELDIQIDMVYGTSVGSITGAMIAQGEGETVEKLWRELTTEQLFDIKEDHYEASSPLHKIDSKLKNINIAGMPLDEATSYLREIIGHGGAGNLGLWSILNRYVNEDSIRASRIDYGLVVTNLVEKAGEYLYKDEIPAGKMIDYIMASSSCFPAVRAYEINDKKYVDGGYSDNLPLRMALNRKATHIIAVELKAPGVIKSEDVKEAKASCKSFVHISPNFDIGNFLVFDPENSAKLIKLGYLDTLRAYGEIDGKKYSFKKAVFSKSEIESAERIAGGFGMDPAILYDRESFTSELLAVHPKHRSLKFV